MTWLTCMAQRVMVTLGVCEWLMVSKSLVCQSLFPLCLQSLFGDLIVPVYVNPSVTSQRCLYFKTLTGGSHLYNWAIVLTVCTYIVECLSSALSDTQE